ncbi:hypothetical protein B9G55_23920 [Saccharibacillus sp. O16]|nr:hypothetical protein B9G55_23920 [Saccharibacillus sp. O16]
MHAIKEIIRILPDVEHTRSKELSFPVIEYRQFDDEVQDVEIIRHVNAVIPELTFLAWVQLCADLKRYGVKEGHYYMRDLVPYEPDPSGWAYFTQVESNRLFHSTKGTASEMLLYYLPEFERYVLVRLDSHAGQLI